MSKIEGINAWRAVILLSMNISSFFYNNNIIDIIINKMDLSRLFNNINENSLIEYTALDDECFDASENNTKFEID